MVMPGVAYETSASGPFMRDINSQTGDSDQELYWYMNSGHVRTEPWRFGLQGPYAMAFGAADYKPSENLDTSFFSGLSIQGYVAASGRGAVSGTASGVPSEFESVVHFYNTNAQYWAKASGGKYTSPQMKPGAYSVKLYKGEFLVANDTVTVTAGQTAMKNVVSKEPNTPVIWRIGNFDGQPFELKNGDKITRMHPSDARMGTWGGTYTVGSSKASDFPMALWAKEAGAATVTFTLTQEQVKGHVLRIGTTLSFKGGRPSVKVNSWTGTDPRAPVSRLANSEAHINQEKIGTYRFARGYPWSLSWLGRCLYLERPVECVQGRVKHTYSRCLREWRCDLAERKLHCRCTGVARLRGIRVIVTNYVHNDTSSHPKLCLCRR
jgi:rhamnogalacturonan endolyase